MLLKTKSLVFAKKHLLYFILFWPEKYKQSAPSNVFLNGVQIRSFGQFFDQDKYLGVLLNASLKDDDDI